MNTIFNRLPLLDATLGLALPVINSLNEKNIKVKLLPVVVTHLKKVLVINLTSTQARVNNLHSKLAFIKSIVKYKYDDQVVGACYV